MIKLNSYINFDGQAKEACEFYKSIFGGEAYIDTFGSFGEKSGMPYDAGDKDKVMHAFLKGDNGVELMLSDAPMGMATEKGSNISLTLNGDDKTTLTDYFNKLSENGKITVPLDKSPWGDIFGMLTDKYGINWMVNISTTQQSE